MADLNLLNTRKKKKGLSNVIERASQNEASFDRKNYVDRDAILILPELESYIRKQDKEEAELFRESIEVEGIREPLLLVNIENYTNLLIDGHHRYRASENVSTVPVKYITTLHSLDDIKLWMLKNQLGRRNLLDAERIDIALKITEFMAKKAKENQLASLKQNQEDTVLSNLTKREKINTREEVSKLSGASTGNIAKYKKIKKEASPEVLNDVLSGRTSIHSAYQGITSKSKKLNLQETSLQKKLDNSPTEVKEISVEELKDSLQKIEQSLLEAQILLNTNNKGNALVQVERMIKAALALRERIQKGNR